MSNEQTVQLDANVTATPVEQQIKPSNTEQKLKISTCQDLVKISWPIYKENITKFIKLMLIPLFAFFVLGVITLFSIVPVFFFQPSNITVKYGLFALIAIVVVFAFLLFIYIAVVTQASMFLLIKNHKEKVSIKEVFSQGRKIAKKFFVTNLLIAFFVCLWMLLFIIPGIYMSLAYSFAIWILIMEGIGGTAAIKKSKQLVKGYWWALFGRYFALYILFYVVIAIPAMMFDGKGGLEIMWGVITQILSFLFTPFAMIYIYHIYLDLKKIKNI